MKIIVLLVKTEYENIAVPNFRPQTLSSGMYFQKDISGHFTYLDKVGPRTVSQLGVLQRALGFSLGSKLSELQGCSMFMMFHSTIYVFFFPWTLP